MRQGRIRFIIVRHGETEWNVQQRYQGQLDSPLTANGIRQAEAIAARLASVRADALVCSDLQRARDTAAAIVRCQHPGLPVRYTEALRERNFGILGGLTRAEAQKTLPGVLADYTSGNANYTPPQGESLRDLYDRAAAAMNALAMEFAAQEAHVPAQPERTVIVVTHGGFLGQFMRYVLSIPLEAARAYKFVNAAYNEFSCGVAAHASRGAAEGATAGVAVHFNRTPPHDWLLHVWGDVAHLGDLDAGDDL